IQECASRHSPPLAWRWWVSSFVRDHCKQQGPRQSGILSQHGRCYIRFQPAPLAESCIAIQQLRSRVTQRREQRLLLHYATAQQYAVWCEGQYKSGGELTEITGDMAEGRMFRR